MFLGMPLSTIRQTIIESHSDMSQMISCLSWKIDEEISNQEEEAEIHKRIALALKGMQKTLSSWKEKK